MNLFKTFSSWSGNVESVIISSFVIFFNGRIDWNMMTSWNENIFRDIGLLCGEFTGPGEFPAQRPVTRSFDVLFDLPE